MKYFKLGVITLILFICCTGCLDISTIDTSQAEQTHTVIVNSATVDTCTVSVNGFTNTYDLPNNINTIPLERLTYGVNNVTVTVGNVVKQFDIRINATQTESYDSYNKNYWKTRVEEAQHDSLT